MSTPSRKVGFMPGDSVKSYVGMSYEISSVHLSLFNDTIYESFVVIDPSGLTSSLASSAPRKSLTISNMSLYRGQFPEYPCVPGDTIYLGLTPTLVTKMEITFDTVAGHPEIRTYINGDKTTDHRMVAVAVSGNLRFNWDIDDLFGETTQKINLDKAFCAHKKSSSPMQLAEKHFDWWYVCVKCGEALSEFDKYKK